MSSIASSLSSMENPWDSEAPRAAGVSLFSDPSLKGYSTECTGSMDEGPGLDASTRSPRTTRPSIGADFFNCILASTVLRNHGSIDSGMRLESKLTAAFKSFPYADCLEEIVNRERDGHCDKADGTPVQDGRTDLYAKIGTLLTAGSKNVESYVSSCIQAFVPREIPAEMFAGFNPPPSPPDSLSRGSGRACRPGAGGREHMREQVKPREFRAQDQLGMGIYMTRLQEYCDQEGWHYVHQYKQMGYHESWWKAILLVQGQKFEAEAKSKKDARFQACKQACECFRVKI